MAGGVLLPVLWCGQYSYYIIILLLLIVLVKNRPGNEAKADSVMGTVNHSHTTQPGQPPLDTTKVAALQILFHTASAATTDLHYYCVPVLHSGGSAETVVYLLHSSTA